MFSKFPKLFANLLLVAAVAPVLGLGIYLTDTFQDGTVMFWDGTSITGYVPANIPNGGPNGAGDKYLRIKSKGGTGSGSNLATYNTVNWNGNYLALKITSIECDMKNEGATNLQMRLMLHGGNGSKWVSSAPISVPTGSGWLHVSFPISTSTLTRVSGSGTLNDCLTLVSNTQFKHATTVQVAGTSIVAQLGIDNIFALPGTAIIPTSFIFGPGLHISGTLSNLNYSDDSQLLGQLNQASEETGDPVTLTLAHTSPVASPTGIGFLLECRGEVSDIVQFIDLFDWSLGQFVQIGSSPTSIVDNLRAYQATGTLSRFVKSGTREIRSRIRFNIPSAEVDLPFKVWFDRATIQVTS